MVNQFAELDIRLNKDDLEQLNKKGFIDINCEISIRIKTPKNFK